MKHVDVNSSHIKSIGYDPDTRTMEITFKNGSTYQYDDVDKDTHDEFLEHESIGKFFHNRIKPGFKVRKLR